MIKKGLAVGIIFLFIVSSVTPMVIGYKSYIVSSESENLLEKLAHANYNEYDSLDSYEYKSPLLNVQFDVIDADGITASIISSQTSLSDGPMDSPWPMKCHDNHHTSLSPYNTADNPYEEKWKFHCDRIDGSPVIGDDGMFYFGDFDDYLYALYPNGTMKWRYETDMWIWSAPAIGEDGTVYVGSWDCGLYAINPNGTLKWRFSAGAVLSSCPAIGCDGTIFFGNSDGRFFAVNPNGTKKWHYDTGADIWGDPAIGEDGIVYIGSWDTYFYALYPNNGTLRWRFKTGHYIKGPPSIAIDGTIYIGSWDDYLYALYPNGTMKWRHKVGSGTESNPSIAHDGTIYVGGGYLYAINPNGTRIWTFDFGDNKHSHKSSPAISAEGIIYIGTHIGDDGGGEIIAVNPDGTERWRKRIATNHVDSSPCIGEDGTVYIGSSSDEQGYSYGFLYAFGELDPNAPEAPTISGETDGEAGVEYEYTLSTIDPNDDDVYYYIEWGDGEFEDWFGPYDSGEEVVVSHSWNEKDTYTIRARAKDTDNLWGPWGELEVTMPVNQQTSYPFFQRFLERFPLLSRIFGSMFKI